MEYKALVINPADNVAVVSDCVPAGGAVLLMPGRTQLTALTEIPSCHKISIRDVKPEKISSNTAKSSAAPQKRSTGASMCTSTTWPASCARTTEGGEGK